MYCMYVDRTVQYSTVILPYVLQVLQSCARDGDYCSYVELRDTHRRCGGISIACVFRGVARCRAVKIGLAACCPYH